jgi:hypothetical protein
MTALAPPRAARRPPVAGRRWPALPPPIAWLTGGVLVAALVLGGGTQPGLRSDTMAQLASLALVAALLWRLARPGAAALPRLPAVLIGLVAALPLAQLVPLPPWLWPHLPGREMAAAGYAEAGMELPSLPISLDPAATRLAFLSLLPALAIALAVLSLEARHRRYLTLLVVLFAFASILVGLAQAQLGAAGPLRLFERTSGAVGLFANRNHYAALVAASMPLAAAWAVGLFAERRPGSAMAAALLLLLYAALLLGLAMARSRTGLALAGAAGLASLALAWMSAAPQARGRIAGLMLGAIVFGLVLVANFALLSALERLDGDLAADYRWDILRATADATAAFAPVGSGFGTFPAIYRMFEPAALMRPFHANHAHNDALELAAGRRAAGAPPAARRRRLARRQDVGAVAGAAAGGRRARPGARPGGNRHGLAADRPFADRLPTAHHRLDGGLCARLRARRAAAATPACLIPPPPGRRPGR